MSNLELQLDNCLWRFSLKVYARAEVRAMCLRLQDDHQVNVNNLLLGAWLHSGGTDLSIDQWRHLVNELQPLLAITEQLRGQRRALKRILLSLPGKTSDETQLANRLKDTVLRLELVSEQYQQALLYTAVADLQQADEILPLRHPWHHFIQAFGLPCCWQSRLQAMFALSIN